MTVCKYMSAHWGLDYLKNWHLKITPPAEFNDPFELRPPAPAVYRVEDTVKSVRSLDINSLAADLAKRMEPQFPALNSVQVLQFVESLMPSAAPEAKSRVRKMLRKKMPKFTATHYLVAERRMHAGWPKIFADVQTVLNHSLPAINAVMQKKITEHFPAILGVLCFSRHSNQPLMWSHYGESHRGFVFEFDEAHPSLKRRRTDKDEFGFLRDVSYSEKRPELNMEAIDRDQGFQVFALTKSLHWSYEEEARLVWPLESADKRVEAPSGDVALLSIPPSALVSVTLGCKATPQQELEVLRLLSEQSLCAHIRVRRARMHDTEFSLVYDAIER